MFTPCARLRCRPQMIRNDGRVAMLCVRTQGCSLPMRRAQRHERDDEYTSPHVRHHLNEPLLSYLFHPSGAISSSLCNRNCRCSNTGAQTIQQVVLFAGESGCQYRTIDRFLCCQTMFLTGIMCIMCGSTDALYDASYKTIARLFTQYVTIYSVVHRRSSSVLRSR